LAIAALRKATALTAFSSGFIWGEGDAGSIVDHDTGELPAGAFAARSSIALTGAVAGDRAADTADPAEFLDVEVDHLDGTGALIAPYGLGRVEIPHPAQASAA